MVKARVAYKSLIVSNIKLKFWLCLIFKKKGKGKASKLKVLVIYDFQKKGKRKLPAEKLSKLETRKEKKAKKDPYKPKRAPTAFFVFLEDFRKTFKKEIQIVVSAVSICQIP
ncbi:hypothetical protein Bca4012_031967 [Brassica carinata]|uniref:(rape) hypothetical protein n=1 Tax=Brassica napus TaxID=3708 RepID=A0A816JKY2_BRANA|nr:unnamed protein product [Brassica napus]